MEFLEVKNFEKLKEFVHVYRKGKYRKKINLSSNGCVKG